MKVAEAARGGRNANVAEPGLAVLRAQIADKQPPGEFARSEQVTEQVAQEPRRVFQRRFGRIDCDGDAHVKKLKRLNADILKIINLQI